MTARTGMESLDAMVADLRDISADIHAIIDDLNALLLMAESRPNARRLIRDIAAYLDGFLRGEAGR